MATWRDLTYTFGAYLTSSQLNQMQGNFPAVAQNDDEDSAPQFKMEACQDWTVEASARGTSLGAGVTWTPTHGLYQIHGDYPDVILQVNRTGTWVPIGNNDEGNALGGLCPCDGTNMRVKNNGASAHAYSYIRYSSTDGSSWTWTDLVFSFGSYLTATEMLQLQDNFYAMLNGVSGAPQVFNFDMTKTAQGYFAVNFGASWTPSAGVYMVAGGELYGEMYISGAWATGAPEGATLWYSDGSTTRFRENFGTLAEVAYFKFN